MADYPDIDVSDADWIDEGNFNPRYNIAPRSNAPVIRRQSPEDSDLVIHTMKWGVVPHWSKHEDLTLNTINARAENLVESGGMWNTMKSHKRCVVVCDGYFEWLKKGKDRLPHFTRRKDGKFMILAGLYDSVLLEGAEAPLWTFTIVTTDAAPSFLWLHDRQPVILSSTADFEAWLDTSKGWHAGLAGLLKSRHDAELECFPVPKEVGRVGANSASFIQPVSQRKDGIEAMFAKQAAKGRQANAVSSSNNAPSSTSSFTFSNSDATPSPGVASSSKVTMDGKTPKRAIEIDCSPLPSPSSKKQKLDHSREGKTKRSMEGDAEGESAKKRQKGLEESRSRSKAHACVTQDAKDEVEGSSARLAAESSPTTKSVTEALSSSPRKTPRSKRNAEDPRPNNDTRITAFFPALDPRTVRGSPAV